MTKKASNNTSSRIASDRSHSEATIFPRPLRIIRPSRIAPKRHRRSWVRPSEHFLASLRAQIVTKYAANVRESKAGCRGFVRLRIGGPYLWGDVSFERHITAVGHNVEIQDGPTPIG